jgi:hypothetical protein
MSAATGLSTKNLWTLHECKQQQALLASLKEKMHNSAYYRRLQAVLKALMGEMEGQGSAGGFQTAMKLVVWEIIDDLYAGREEIGEAPGKEALKASFSVTELSPNAQFSPDPLYHSFQSPPKPRKREFSTDRSPPHSASKSYGRFTGREDEIDSGFVDIKGPATFNRERRKTPVVQESPGPGAYSPNIRAVKQTPPRAHIPTSGMRVDLAQHHSPGPAYYTPHSHFLAKRPLP